MFTANADWEETETTKRPEGHEYTENPGYDGMTNWYDDGSCYTTANAFWSGGRSSSSGQDSVSHWIRKKYHWEGTPSDGNPYSVTKDVDIEVDLRVRVSVQANDDILVSSEVAGYARSKSDASASGGGGSRMKEAEEAKINIKAKHSRIFSGWTITLMVPRQAGITIPLSGRDHDKDETTENRLLLGGGYTFSRDGAQIYAGQYTYGQAKQKNGDWSLSQADAEVMVFSFD